MPASRVATFCDTLRELQLLDGTQLGEVARLAQGQGDDPMPLAKDLIQRKWLTPFQVNLLVKGSGKELTIGPYRILDRLGEGGMGYVYKAIHPTMGRMVALKVIKKERLSNSEAVRRFQQEVEAAGKLNHPNIVRAFDAGQVGPTQYFAMEYVEGIDLKKLVKQNGPLSVLEACDYVRQAALGLQHAHERGLVHRDIKPPNLLVSRASAGPNNNNGPASAANLFPRAVVKILDMGLARLGDGDDSNALTRIGTAIGTPEFMAPEQAQNSHTADIRADIYSLGCTFYYLLSGQPPFSGKTIGEVLVKHLMEEAQPLDQKRQDVPPHLWLVIKRMMAKKAEDRYQTPAEVVVALNPFNRRTAPTTAPSGAKPPAVAPPPVTANRPVPTLPKDARQMLFADMANSPTDGVNRWRRRRRLKRLATAAVILLFLSAIVAAALHVDPALWQLAGFGPPRERTPSETNVRPDTNKAAPRPETKIEPEPKVEPKVEPKIEPKVDPKIEPKIEPEPKTEPKPVPKKLAIPDKIKQAEIERDIRTKYREDYLRKKPSEIAALAEKLLQEGIKTKQSPAERYVLLTEARDLAMQVGELETAMQAVDELAKTFAIVAIEVKVDTLKKAYRKELPQATQRTFADVALALADDAVAEDNYEAALDALAVARAAALKLSTSALTPIRKREDEVKEIQKEYNAAKSVLETLSKTPDDPEANARWGRFLTLFKGSWSKGLPLLAQGNDDKLKSVAEKDLVKPTEPVKQVELGNEYWTLGEAQKSALARKLLQIRARDWYEQAIAGGLSEPMKGQVEKRLTSVDTTVKKDEIKLPDKPMTPTTTPNPTQQQYDKSMQAGWAALQKGRYQDAIVSYNKALELKPDDPRATTGLRESRYYQHLAAGQEHLRAGEFGRARREFEKALDEKPGDATASQLLFQARRAMKSKFGN
jgi:serine/threonine protein kinase/tetratricopeptide (TPR) repeat protein